MRKSIFIILALLGVLSACDKNAYVSDGTISFQVESLQLSETRAKVDGEIFPNGSSFGVLGYCLAYENQSGAASDYNNESGTAAWNTKKVFAAPYLFYKQEVKKENNAWSYRATSTTSALAPTNGGLVQWYHNVNYLYTFLAYYPYSGWTIAPTGMTTIGEPKVSRTVTVGVGADDIPDIMTAQLIDTKQGGGSVKFNFQHHLTGLKMRFTNYDDEEITINSIKLNGSFYNKIDVGLNSRSVSGAQSISIFENLNGEMPPFANGIASTYETGEVFLLSDGVQFGNNISIAVTSTRIDHPTNTISFGTDANSLNFNPQPGIIYTIDVAYQGDGAIVVSVIADNGGMWEGGTSTDSDILFE